MNQSVLVVTTTPGSACVGQQAFWSRDEPAGWPRDSCPTPQPPSPPAPRPQRTASLTLGSPAHFRREVTPQRSAMLSLGSRPRT